MLYQLSYASLLAPAGKRRAKHDSSCQPGQTLSLTQRQPACKPPTRCISNKFPCHGRPELATPTILPKGNRRPSGGGFYIPTRPRTGRVEDADSAEHVHASERGNAVKLF